MEIDKVESINIKQGITLNQKDVFKQDLDAKQILRVCSDNGVVLLNPVFILTPIEGKLARLQGRRLITFAKEKFGQNDKKIEELFFTNANKVIIKPKDNSVYEQIAKITEVCGVKVRVSLALNSYTKKAIIRQIDTDISALEIAEELRDNGFEPISIFRLKRKVNETRMNTRSVVVSIITNVIPKRIRLFYMMHATEEYNESPKICHNCGNFGHYANFCKGTTKCKKCGDKHAEETCESEGVICLNCKGRHSYLDRECPEYLKQKNIIEYKNRNNVSYMEAKGIFEAQSRVSHAQVLKRGLNETEKGMSVELKNTINKLVKDQVQAQNREIRELINKQNEFMENLSKKFDTLISQMMELGLNANYRNASSSKGANLNQAELKPNRDVIAQEEWSDILDRELYANTETMLDVAARTDLIKSDGLSYSTRTERTTSDILSSEEDSQDGNRGNKEKRPKIEKWKKKKNRRQR